MKLEHLFRLYTILAISLFTNNVYSQKTKETDNQELNKFDKEYVKAQNIFKNSLKYGDLAVAKHSLFEMIYLNPNDKSLKDSLALIYLNLGATNQSYLLSKEILSENPNNFTILEVKAISEQSLGIYKEALASYESLFLNSKSIFHLYQIATLQFELKRLGECNMTIQQLLNMQDIEKKEINIATGERDRQQKINLKAAVLNIKGVLLIDINDFQNAKIQFEEALKLSSNFVLANNNLKFVNSKLLNKNTSPNNTNK